MIFACVPISALLIACILVNHASKSVIEEEKKFVEIKHDEML